MPQYEYRCPRCLFTGEVWARMGEAPKTVSIDCAMRDPLIHPPPTCVLRRIMSTFSGKFGDTHKFHETV